jgi:hypothetical protein
MAVLVNLASQAYAAGKQTFPVAVPANVKTLELTLTREGWPAGDIASASILWSDGSGASVVISGVALDRHGSPATTFEFEVTKPAGVTNGTASLNILQAVTSAVTVVSA